MAYMKRLSASREIIRFYRPYLEAGLMTVSDLARTEYFGQGSLHKLIKAEGIVLGCTSCHGKPRSGRLYCADCAVIVKHERRRTGHY